MIKPGILEESYKEFSRNLTQWVHDEIIHVDLKLLNDLGILNHAELENAVSDAHLNHYFHIIETPDKVTLFNEQFAIWIVPDPAEDTPSTTTLIALLRGNKPHLEIVYTTSGVYNTPKYILKVLQHFLSEVQDTEAILSSIGKK